MSRLRNWFVTLNNYTEEEYAAVCEIKCRYLVVSKEVGEKGTPHLHAYIEFAQPIRFAALKKILPRADLEKRKGTKLQARDYVMKNGDFKEFGTFVDTGARTDLQEVQSEIDDGSSLKDIAMGHFESFCRYGKAFEKYKVLTQSSELRKVQVLWYQGPPGSGKTYSACVEHQGDFFKLVQGNNSNVWFDGYCDQSVLIIDDYDGWIRRSLLLQILDIYPLQVETKGGMIPALWTTVIITTNDRIECQEEAVRRRIAHAYKFENREKTEIPLNSICVKSDF